MLKTIWRAVLVSALLLAPLGGAIAEDVDYTGFWKWNCDDPFGLQIKPYGKRTYSVRFCGPGGECNGPVELKDVTSIDGNPTYEVISPVEIWEKEGDTVYGVLHKCTAETNPVLAYSEADKAEGRRSLAVGLALIVLYMTAALVGYRSLRRRLVRGCPFQRHVARSGLLALFFAPGIYWHFPFAAPTFALLALFGQLFDVLSGSFLFIGPQLMFSGVPILVVWALLVSGWWLVPSWRRSMQNA